MRKTYAVVVSIVAILLSIVIAGTNIKLSKANPVPPPFPLSYIYIRSDGTVDPPGPIQRDEDIYSLAGDISPYSIEIQCDNIILDGKGHVLSGVGSYWYEGIRLLNVKNVTIKNINIRDFSAGIQIENSSSLIILENKMFSLDGIRITSSNKNQIIANSMNGAYAGFDYGIMSNDSHNNTIWGNDFTDFGSAIWLGSGQHNIIVANQFWGNSIGVNLFRSENNILYLNNFLSNFQESVCSSTGSRNFWDNGTSGNFWMNYDGKDGNGDGIGDSPYSIDRDEVDYYPLIKPVSVSDTPFPTPSPSPTPFSYPEPTLESTPEPTSKPATFSTDWVIASASATSLAVIGLIVYFKKYHRSNSP
jgi:parallel beta-helix repeat protein